MAGKWVRGKPPEKERVNFVVNREVDPEVHAFLMSIPYGRSGDYIRAILRAYVAEHGHARPEGVQRDRKRAQVPVRILYEPDEPDEVVEPSEPVVPALAPRVRPKPVPAAPAPAPRSSVQESQSQPPASVAEKEKSSGGGSDQDLDAWSQLAGQFGL